MQAKSKGADRSNCIHWWHIICAAAQRIKIVFENLRAYCKV